MPELPEVETIRRDLQILVNKKIGHVEILSKKIAQPSALFLIKELAGKKVIGLERRGKLLIFSLENNSFLLIHLKMTGQLVFVDKKNQVSGGHSLSEEDELKAIGGPLPNKYTRAIFSFSENGQLFFNDLRKFGYLRLVNKLELDRLIKNNYGPEPLSKEFKLERFKESLKNRKTTIKALLLNQKFIAGLGNIYVDESLFIAQIKPTRLASGLTEKESTSLYLAINEIIKRAIKARGTTFNNYRDARGKKGSFFQELKVYGRANQPCFKCSQPIKKIKLAGRGTHYCSNCQK